jgi:hypothetical protein
MSWSFNGNVVTPDDVPDGMIGFVYKIIHLPTNRYYIGKKSLTSTRRIKMGKRELAVLKAARKIEGISGRLPSKKEVRKPSDWETYYGSNDWIREQVKLGNANEFTREIIQFCHSKKSLSYWEMYWQFQYNVLNDTTSLNENIGGRFFHRDL